MSGIIALARFDGGRVEPEILDGAVRTLTVRGPDGTAIWTHGGVGLGVAHLRVGRRTTRRGDVDTVPTLPKGGTDDGLRIVADVRIDDRASLCARLADGGENVRRDTSDAELVLHAYRRWGLDAFGQLLGSFACILWDGPRRQLIAARDPLGTRPLYTARWGDGFAISNTLETLLGVVGAPRDLDHDSIADYLLFDHIRSPTATPFAGVRQLAPAHWRTFDGDGASPPRRYWSFDDLASHTATALPDTAWPEAFRETLATAVADRADADAVAVMMSGGLDSTAVAGLIPVALGPRAPRVALHTASSASVMTDHEAHFALQMAATLEANHVIHEVGNARLFEDWDVLKPPPVLGDFVLAAAGAAMDRAMCHDARIALTGYGGDPLMAPDTGYFLRQLRHLRWLRAWRYLREAPRRTGRALPPLGLDTLRHRRRERRAWADGFPPWLSEDFVATFDLKTRWREAGEDAFRTERDPCGRLARELGTMWTAFFELADAGAKRQPLQLRYPFLDLRLLGLAVQMPAVPWRVEKTVLRKAMCGIVPDQVRTRPKCGLSGLPPNAPSRKGSELWREWYASSTFLDDFFRPSSVLEALDADETQRATALPIYRWLNRRPLNLGWWMRVWNGSLVDESRRVVQEVGLDRVSNGRCEANL